MANRWVDKMKKLFCIKWKYLFYGSYVYVDKTSSFTCEKDVKIVFSKIHLQKGSTMSIGKGVSIHKVLFALSGSHVKIGEKSVFSNGEMPIKQQVIVSNGNMVFGTHNRIRAQRFWVRFGGIVNFGNYINLNEYSEVRCDEKVSLGDFVEISYYVKIWDTNTHEIEPLEQRRARWRGQYLKRDVSEKPKTTPVTIGSDTWIGERSSILKGTTIGQGCIVGYDTTLVKEDIPDGTMVVRKVELKKIQYNK